MNRIVILCGSNNCGKTTTLRGFFRLANNAPSPYSYVERRFNGRIVCAVGFNSPQEQSKFCNVEQVQENIKERIRNCDEQSKGEPYILLIPFTMSGSRTKGKKTNEDCILKPIEEMKKRFAVSVIYLRKTNARNLAEKDALMKDVAVVEIETTKLDYDKSAELEKFLKEEIGKL